MKNNHKYLILLSFFSLAFLACEVVVDVNLDVEPRPVINMLLTPNNDFVALINESLPNEDYFDQFYENPFTEIKDASVKITDNDGVTFDLPYEVLDLEDSYFLPVEGVYKNETKPVYGKTYTLTVEMPNFETVTAETTFPEPTKIEKVDTSNYFGRIDPLDIDAEPADYLKLTVEFENIPNETNYFGLKIRNTEGANPYFVFPKYQNIARELTYYRGFQLFNDDLLEEGKVQFEILVDNYIVEYYEEYPEEIPVFTDLEVVLATFNKDMFQYIETAKNQTQSDGFLEELFFEPINVYSNINKGLGIFAAMTTDTVLLNL